MGHDPTCRAGSSQAGQFSAQQVYANKVMVNHHGGAIKVGDYVYGYSDGKGWTCQNFKTGEAKWQEKQKAHSRRAIDHANGGQQEDHPRV